jgi:hypothetical protein
MKNVVFWDVTPCGTWRYVPPKRRFLQEPHGVTSQNTEFPSNKNRSGELSSKPRAAVARRRFGNSEEREYTPLEADNRGHR